MKKLTVTLLLFSFFYSNAQSVDDSKPILERSHEVKIGAIKLLAGPIFEGSYEYIQDSNTGFGAIILLNLNKDNDYFEDYSLTPFYRMYFQSYEDYGAKGFFVEGFTSFYGAREFIVLEDIFGMEEERSFFDIAVGIGLGKKWINTAGFVFEIKIGGGRSLLGNGDLDFILKGDLSIGYRF